MEFKGSKTEENLKKAYAGESEARSKYHYYASQAKKEGYEQLADIFEETGNNELAHAKMWFKLLHGNKIPDTQTNLEDAIKCEEFEWSDMYVEFAKVAREEGFEDIAKSFEGVGAIEKLHESRYDKLLKNLKEGKIFKKDEKVEWVCRVCGHVHVSKKAPTVCPVCGHPEAFFQIKAFNY